MTTASRRTTSRSEGDAGPQVLDLDGPRVLVADDQPDVLEALRLLLKPHGCHVRTVSSPAAVIAAIGDGAPPFDLLLMDLNYARDTTSGDEGLELVARVKALDPHPPVVVMTAWSTVSLAVATMREGVGDFVQKPWENARLLETVRTQVAAGRRRRRAQRPEADARDVQRRLPGSSRPRCPATTWPWLFGSRKGWAATVARGRAARRPPGRGHRGRVRQGHAGRAAHGQREGEPPEELVAADPAPRRARARLARTLAPRLGPTLRLARLAVLDPARGTLAYANAGHPAPVLLRPDGAVRRLKRGGPVLGVVAEADYEEGLLALDRGDRLVLVTDGITEATSRAERSSATRGSWRGCCETRAAAAAEAAPRSSSSPAASPTTASLTMPRSSWWT
jgi:FixJ family two-component response regulator